MTTTSNGEPSSRRVPSTAEQEEEERSIASSGISSTAQKEQTQFQRFVVLLTLDAVVSSVLLAPRIKALAYPLDETSHYTVYGSLYDLFLLAAVRLGTTVIGLLVAYWTHFDPPEFPFDTHHPNGDKKSREELEFETLEEGMGPWMSRFVRRPSFVAETMALIYQVWAIVKALMRMNQEIGVLQSKPALHPLFWVVLMVTTICCVLEVTYLESICRVVGRWGQSRNNDNNSQGQGGFLRSLSSTLSLPLLANDHTPVPEEGAPENGTEADGEASAVEDPAEVRGVSDIGADSSYKASWTDLLVISAPDAVWIFFAFVFLLLAAIAQVFIPRFLGNILDVLANEFRDGGNRDTNMWEVPDFMSNVQLLVGASIAAGGFSGLRGSIFTVVGGRVNVRLRVLLMDSLLAQDIGFFDVTKTGDITSRLSSDTTLVGDQVTLNINVFLRSLVQALGVLGFMFFLSWQLSILAFISVPIMYVRTVIKSYTFDALTFQLMSFCCFFSITAPFCQSGTECLFENSPS